MSLSHIERAKLWLTDSFDSQTVESVKQMIEMGGNELEDSFYKNLEFGTGGLRGVMGVGTNRINRYTIGMATQGFANYLKEVFKDREEISVAVSYDNRVDSPLFAQITADVMSANGIKVLMFNSLKPTPQLSFTIRHYNCCGGVMITASHNPKEYNGYKVYWQDGAQVLAPHDKNIIDHVNKILDPSMVKFSGDKNNIQYLGKEADEAYLSAILSLTLNREVKERGSDLKIVYTPLHGTGVLVIPEALRRAGFNNVINVPEQDVTDGNFPTVESPNPEEPDALKMALEVAQKSEAQLVMATDPDSDRLGIAVRDRDGEYILIDGNQMAAILMYYILDSMSSAGTLNSGKGGDYMVKTIVTSNLLTNICKSYDVEIFDVLTGFKYIAEIVRLNEGKRRFIAGGEESYGFNIGQFVRDKDAVVTCCLVAEAAFWSNSKGMTLLELLKEIHLKFGFYKEHLISITKRGKEGQEQISAIMKQLISNPPKTIDGSKVILLHNYQSRESTDIVKGERYPIELPKSNVIQFVTLDNTIVSVRPSGTEPKIKFYFSINSTLSSLEEYHRVDKILSSKIERVVEQFTSY